MKSAYEKLRTRFARLGNLNGAAAVLNWDAAAIMPSGGSGARAEQVATLALLGHELLCAPEIAELLEQAETQNLSRVRGRKTWSSPGAEKSAASGAQ